MFLKLKAWQNIDVSGGSTPILLCPACSKRAWHSCNPRCSTEQGCQSSLSSFLLYLAAPLSNLGKIFEEYHFEGCQIISQVQPGRIRCSAVGDPQHRGNKSVREGGDRSFPVHLMEILEGGAGFHSSHESPASGTIKVLNKWESSECKLDSQSRHKTRTNKREGVASQHAPQMRGSGLQAIETSIFMKYHSLIKKMPSWLSSHDVAVPYQEEIWGEKGHVSEKKKLFDLISFLMPYWSIDW